MRSSKDFVLNYIFLFLFFMTFGFQGDAPYPTPSDGAYSIGIYH
jgi:hypothetical protein